jgi:hypothetical protein
MSAHAPRPSASRPRKLVLRKIAEGSYPRPASTTSTSSLTPLPMVRPPPRPSSAVLPESSSSVVVPQAIYALDTAAVAAMTPAAPRTAEVFGRPQASSPRTPLPSAMPAADPYSYASARAFVPTTPVVERYTRNTVAPVVASLPPQTIASSPSQRPMPARFSADSKLLAGGGALAATMLALAVGVFLGKGSVRSSAVAVSAPVSYLPAAESRAASGSAPFVAVDPPPPAAMHATEEKPAIEATVDVQQLPVAAPRYRMHPWVVATAKVPNATGWTVADPQPSTTGAAATAAKGQLAAAAADAPSQADETAALQQVPANAPAAIDPLVQAVRDDIREDEAARSK